MVVMIDVIAVAADPGAVVAVAAPEAVVVVERKVLPR